MESTLELQEQASARDGGIQVIARAAAILRTIAASPEGVGLGPLSKKVSLPRSTVQRIVTALESERLVESGGADGVRLGPGLSALAATIRPGVFDAVRPFMETLSKDLQETVVIARMRRHEIIVVDQVVADRELSFRARLGSTFPISCTAGGKALLAEMADSAVAALLGADLPRPTATSPANLPALMLELSEIRRSGLAYDHETNGEGLCAVAVAVQSPDKRDWTHAVSVVVPTARFHNAHISRMDEKLLAFRESIRRDFMANDVRPV